MTLIQKLEQRGVKLTPKLTYKSDAPLDSETLELLKIHKAALLRDLTAPDTLARFPWQLEALLRAANSDVLPQGMQSLEGGGLVYDLRTYTLACAASSYLLGDRDEALKRLWQAHRIWKG